MKSPERADRTIQHGMPGTKVKLSNQVHDQLALGGVFFKFLYFLYCDRAKK